MGELSQTRFSPRRFKDAEARWQIGACGRKKVRIVYCGAFNVEERSRKAKEYKRELVTSSAFALLFGFLPSGRGHRPLGDG